MYMETNNWKETTDGEPTKVVLSQTGSPYELLDTATDVLRYIVGRENNDTSLEKLTFRIPNLSRPDRKALLGRLDEMSYDHVIADFSRNTGTWKRIAQVLHAGDYAKLYPNASRAFKSLAEGKLSNPFNRMIENLLWEKKWRVVSGILVDHPHEFALRLNNLYNLAETKKNCIVVLGDFMKVTSQIPPVTLWKMLAFFENSDGSPRGTKTYSEAIGLLTFEVILDEIKEKYAQKAKSGKTCDDPELYKYEVPMKLFVNNQDTLLRSLALEHGRYIGSVSAKKEVPVMFNP